MDKPCVGCPIIHEYRRMMSRDSSYSVREAAVQAVCISKATLPDLVKRTRDVHKAVRAAAFRKLEVVLAQDKRA